MQGQAKKMGGLGSETLNSKAILLIFLSVTELFKIFVGVQLGYSKACQLYIYLYLLFFRFFSHGGHYRVPCAKL